MFYFRRFILGCRDAGDQDGAGGTDYCNHGGTPPPFIQTPELGKWGGVISFRNAAEPVPTFVSCFVAMSMAQGGALLAKENQEFLSLAKETHAPHEDEWKLYVYSPLHK